MSGERIMSICDKALVNANTHAHHIFMTNHFIDLNEHNPMFNCIYYMKVNSFSAYLEHSLPKGYVRFVYFTPVVLLGCKNIQKILWSTWASPWRLYYGVCNTCSLQYSEVQFTIIMKISFFVTFIAPDLNIYACKERCES